MAVPRRLGRAIALAARFRPRVYGDRSLDTPLFEDGSVTQGDGGFPFSGLRESLRTGRDKGD